MFWPSVVAVIASLLTMLAIALFLKESLPAEKRSQADDPGGDKAGRKPGSFGHIMRRPMLAPMVLMGFLVFFAMTNFETTFPLWADAGFSWGPQQVGFMFMYLGFVVMVTQMFIVGKVAPIFGEGRLLQFAVCAYIFGLLFMAIVPFTFEPANWRIMIFGITFTALGGAMFNTASTSWVSKQAGEQERGAVQGLYQSAGWLGRSVGPTISRPAVSDTGPQCAPVCWCGADAACTDDRDAVAPPPRSKRRSRHLTRFENRHRCPAGAIIWLLSGACASTAFESIAAPPNDYVAGRVHRSV